MVCKGTQNLSITWVPFAPHHSAALQMAASASHSQATAPPGAALACLPLAPHFALVPGALGKFILQIRRQRLASCLPGKREGLEGMALPPASHPSDPPGTKDCPPRVGKAEWWSADPTHPTPTWPLEFLPSSPPTLEPHIRGASTTIRVTTEGHMRVLETLLPFPRCLSSPSPRSQKRPMHRTMPLILEMLGLQQVLKNAC